MAFPGSGAPPISPLEYMSPSAAQASPFFASHALPNASAALAGSASTRLEPFQYAWPSLAQASVSPPSHLGVRKAGELSMVCFTIPANLQASSNWPESQAFCRYSSALGESSSTPSFPSA